MRKTLTTLLICPLFLSCTSQKQVCASNAESIIPEIEKTEDPDRKDPLDTYMTIAGVIIIGLMAVYIFH
jgi:hypothetical protein